MKSEKEIPTYELVEGDWSNPFIKCNVKIDPSHIQFSNFLQETIQKLSVRKIMPNNLLRLQNFLSKLKCNITLNFDD